MSFLPKDHSERKEPVGESYYMKFKTGENRFRPLYIPIVGYEWWVSENGLVRVKGEKPQKGDKPMRARVGDEIPVEAADSYKYFWTMVVWNVLENKVQILHITQKSIRDAIEGYINDKDWGNPKGKKGYDIVVERSGEGLETEYTTRAKPKSDLDEGVVKMADDMHINLEALYDNEDPFNSDVKTESDQLADDVEKAIG